MSTREESTRESHPDRPTSEAQPDSASGRRRFLVAGLTGVAGAIGGAAGYGYAREIDHYGRVIADNPPGRRDFHAHRRAIQKRHNQQTREIVTHLKSRYEQAVFGKLRVWDLIEKLALCVDPTDATLYCTSQFIHVQQILAGMERDAVADPDLILAALLHDVGKVLLLTDELPENIVCRVEPVEDHSPGIGLDRVLYQFGHGEMIYSRMKDHVPDQVAWLLRYHAILMGKSQPYMDKRDLAYAEKYLRPFARYDGDKSSTRLPQLDLRRYRAMIEDMFPHPILF